MRQRPRREDIPDDTTPADVLLELRQLAYDFESFLEDRTSDLIWLRQFRAKVGDVWRLTLVTIPVVVAAILGILLVRP